MLKKYFNLKTSNDERYCKNDFILFFKRRVSYSKLNLLYYFYDAEKVINSKLCFYKKTETNYKLFSTTALSFWYLFLLTRPLP